MEFLALSAPWILLLLIVIAICLLLFRRRKFATGLLLLAMAGNWWFEVMPVGVLSKVSSSKFQVQGNELKVLSFNCNLSHKQDNREEKRSKIKAFINKQVPEVVFLTENFINRDDSLWLILQEVYPYRVKQKNSVGNSLYSKYPILSDTIYKEKGQGYGITYCQIEVKGKRLEVIGVHLSSNNYNEQMVYMTPDSVATGAQAHTYLKNIVTASEYRVREVERLAEFQSSRVPDGSKESIIPTIVMGDFNDVCGSPTMRILESAGLKDAWWEGGFGYGATINTPLPFRIDHILYNEGLKLRNIKKVSANSLSDHDALVATFSINGI